MHGLALRVYKRFKRSHPVRDLHATFRFGVRSAMQYDCHNERSNAAGVMISLGLSRVARTLTATGDHLLALPVRD